MVPKRKNAAEKLKPVTPFAGAITNLKQIRDKPEIDCCTMLFTDDMVARVSSLANKWMWLMLAMAKESWNPIPMQTKIKLKQATYGSLK